MAAKSRTSPAIATFGRCFIFPKNTLGFGLSIRECCCLKMDGAEHSGSFLLSRHLPAGMLFLIQPMKFAMGVPLLYPL